MNDKFQIVKSFLCMGGTFSTKQAYLCVCATVCSELLCNCFLNLNSFYNQS